MAKRRCKDSEVLRKAAEIQRKSAEILVVLAREYHEREREKKFRPATTRMDGKWPNRPVNRKSQEQLGNGKATAA